MESISWLFLLLVTVLIGIWFLNYYLKDKDKRKLIFSIAFLSSSLVYIYLAILSMGYYAIESNLVIHNLYHLAGIPVMIAVFIASNECFLPVKKFDTIFKMFLVFSVFCFIMIVAPFSVAYISALAHWIIGIEVIVISSYLYLLRKEISALMFLLSMICFVVGGFALARNILYLSIFSYLMAYMFLALVFVVSSKSEEKQGVDSYFSLKDELNTVQNALQESEARYKRLFDSSPDAIMLLAEDGEILSVNPVMVKGLGESVKDLEGKNIHNFLPEDLDEKRTIAAKKALETGEFQEDEDERAGRYFHNTFVPIFTADGKKNIQIIARDVTSQKKAEEEIKEKVRELEDSELATLNIMEDLQETIEDLKVAEKEIKDKNEELETNAENLQMINQELNVAKEQLAMLNQDLEEKVQQRTAEIEKLLRQKDEFIGQLGHDLKTPLTPLNTLLPIIRNKVDDPKIKELLDVNIKNVEYMKNLVFKTLQLAQLSLPKATFDFETTNLLTEISEIIDNKAVILEENDMVVEIDIDKELFVNADSLQLQELFNNLISNVTKYTEGAGTITIEAKEDEKGFTLVSVKDTGIGMTKEQLEHIFDEFYKADGARHDLDFHGLGLSICKRIVEKHGGKIWVESAGPKKGSTFHFTLQSVHKKK